MASIAYVSRQFTVILAFSLAAASLSGQVKPQSMPQTARQALIEMFFSKTPGTLAKHLPSATLAALEKSDAMASLQQYSLMASAMHLEGTNLQTFDTGSILLSSDDPKTQQKFEAVVENDALRGDDDEIEVSFLAYNNGTVQRTPFMPRTTFSMKMETGIWRLNEISVTVHLPLADPDLLKSFTAGMKARAAMATGGGLTSSALAVTPASESSILTAMRTILTAETTYARSYSAIGHTCTLSDLDGFGGGEANEHQAMLINSGLASGKKYGYIFSLSGCSGAPSAGFVLTASPGGNNSGRKAYCADQTGLIRSSADGNPAACMTTGTPVQ